MSSIYSRQNPSPRYLELIKMYEDMHVNGFKLVREDGTEAFEKPENAFNNSEPLQLMNELRAHLVKHECKTLFDYGAGKGEKFRTEKVRNFLGLNSMSFWDPAVSNINSFPHGQTYDCVICTDVLEHIPVQDLEWVLTEIFTMANKAVFLTVTCTEAYAILPDGTNAHVTIMTPEEWTKLIFKVRDNIKPKFPTSITTYYGRH